MSTTATDTVVYFFHQHGPTIEGRRHGWNPPVGLGLVHDYFDPMTPEWVAGKLTAAARRPEFAVPDEHWSRWRVIPRDTAPRGKDLAGRFRGVQVDMAEDLAFLAGLRQHMQLAEMFTRDTTRDVDVPPLYATALSWLTDGESDPVKWARMVRHSIACGITHPRVASELGVDLDRVYAVVTDPWREHHLTAAARFRSSGLVKEAEREERQARTRERSLEP